MFLALSVIGAVIALGLSALKRQPEAVEADTTDAQPVSKKDAYMRHRTWLLSELSRPDLKTFAVLASNIALASILVKDAKMLVPQLFFVVTMTSCAISCLSLYTVLWSRSEKTKVKTVADLDAKVWPTEEQLAGQLLSLEGILRKKHTFFNWALRASAVMTLAAFTGVIV